MPLNPASRQNFLAGIFLFLVVLGIYCLSYSGIPGTDDEQLFAVAAMNAAAEGKLSAEQLFGNTRLQGAYGGIEPLHALAAAGFLKSGVLGTAGQIQGVFWLNALYTALSVFVLYGVVLQSGFARRHAIAAGLAFGFGTLAWPYAKTFFREPLAMLLLLLGWLGLILATQWQRGMGVRVLAGVLAGLFFGTALGVKVMLAAVLPAFGVWIILRIAKYPRPDSSVLWQQAGLTSVILMAVIGLGWLIGGGNLPPRWSTDFILERVRNLRQLPHDGFGTAVAGILFSPGKGLFMYSPFLLAGAGSGWMLRKRRPEVFWLPFLAAIGLIAAQALAYDASWWNLTWGTRFFLPVLPLVVVMGLPGLCWLEERPGSGWWWLVAGLAGVSILIQLGGVLIAEPVYLAGLYDLSLRPVPELVVWNVRYAPWLGHWRLIMAGTPLDLAAGRLYLQGDRRMPGLWVVEAGVVGLSLWGLFSRRSSLNRWAGRAAVAVAGLVLVGAVWWSMFHFSRDGLYALEREELSAAEEWVKAGLVEGDVLVIAPYLYPVWYHALNFGQFPQPWYSWPVPGEDDTSAAALERFLPVASQYQRVWLIEEGPRGGAFFPVAGQLSDVLQPLNAWNFLDEERETVLRVQLYALP